MDKIRSALDGDLATEFWIDDDGDEVVLGEKEISPVFLVEALLRLISIDCLIDSI